MDSISAEANFLVKLEQFKSIPTQDKVKILAQLVAQNQTRAAVLYQGLDVLKNYAAPDKIDLGLIELGLIRGVPQGQLDTHLTGRFETEYRYSQQLSQDLAEKANQQLTKITRPWSS